MALADAARQRIDDCLLTALDLLPSREPVIREFRDAIVQVMGAVDAIPMLDLFEHVIGAKLYPGLRQEIRETVEFLRANP